MSFQNYTSENFVNGFNGNTQRGRPRANRPAPARPDVPVTSNATPVPTTPATTTTASTASTPSTPPTKPTAPTDANLPASSEAPVSSGAAPATPSESASSDGATRQSSTGRNWDAPSTYVLIELFRDYAIEITNTSSPERKAELDAAGLKKFNDHEAVNVTRSLTSMKNKWNDMIASYREKRDAARTTGSAPLPHWEFYDAMEDATTRIATVNPHVLYSSLSGETVDNREQHTSGRRRRFTVEDDDDVEEPVTRRPRNVDVSVWFMANRMEEIDERNRQERADDRRFHREQIELNNRLRRENSEMLREATSAMTRMAELFALSLANNNPPPTSSPSTTNTIDNNNNPTPPSSNDNNI